MDVDKLEDKLLKFQTNLKGKTKKLAGLQTKFGVGIFVYMLLLWIFIGVYQRFGFEYTVIALGVSMIATGLKNMVGF